MKLKKDILKTISRTSLLSYMEINDVSTENEKLIQRELADRERVEVIAYITPVVICLLFILNTL